MRSYRRTICRLDRGGYWLWLAATLDGRVQDSDAVFEAKFMLPWHFSEEAAAEKYMPQLQHNMQVVAARTAVLSIITGGGAWVEILAHADPLYQHLIVTAERKFWRCVESGEPPRLFGVEPPKPRLEPVRIVDMSSSNAWAEFAATFARNLVYLYDFGDGWEHTIKVERLADPEPGMLYPRLIEVRGRCPHEDCGGPFGYAELLDAIADPEHERHAELTDWIGDGFDPEANDAEALIAGVAALAKSWSRKTTRKRPQGT